MDANTEINRVAIVGTGLIGSSWAACFLAHGLDVVATDPAPGTEDKVRQYVEAAWAVLTKFGLAQGASTSRLRFESNLKEALADADMVQENAPEREDQTIRGDRFDPPADRHIGVEYFWYPNEPNPIRVQAPGALRNRTSV